MPKSKSTSRICLAYEEGGVVKRTRFFASTSKRIIGETGERIQATKGNCTAYIKEKWEEEFGPINRTKAPAVPYVDPKFLPPTKEMKLAAHKAKQK